MYLERRLVESQVKSRECNVLAAPPCLDCPPAIWQPAHVWLPAQDAQQSVEAGICECGPVEREDGIPISNESRPIVTAIAC